MKLSLPLLFSTALLVAAQSRPSIPPNGGFQAVANKAEAARHENNPQQAVELYRRAVAIKPNWSEGWWYLGTLYYDTDQYPEGREAFHHLTLLEPKMAVAWAMLGLCEFETRNYDRSLEHLQRSTALGLAPTESFFAVARYHEALLLTRSEQFQPAIEILSKTIAHDGTGPKLIEAIGIAALFKPLLPTEVPPAERELVMAVGRAMSDGASRRSAEARTELEALIRDNPDKPQLHYLYGLILLAADTEKALSAFNDELAISPNHYEAMISIANEYVKRTDYKSALPFAEKAVAAAPGYFAAHAVLGRILVDGDIDAPKGARELETAARLSPSNLQVQFALASAYAKLGRKDDAARARAEFLRLRAQTDSAAVAKRQQ